MVGGAEDASLGSILGRLLGWIGEEEKVRDEMREGRRIVASTAQTGRDGVEGIAGSRRIPTIHSRWTD